MGSNVGDDFYPVVESLAISGSTLYVGGKFASVGGRPRGNLAAVDAATGAVKAWDPRASDGDNPEVLALAVSGSTIYAGGFFTSMGGRPRNHLAAVDARTGALKSWDPNADSTVRVLAVSGTTVYAGGFFTSVGGRTRNHLAAIDAATGAVRAWDPNVARGYYTEVKALALSGSTVYMAGDFTSVGGQTRNRLAAVDIATGAVKAWDPTRPVTATRSLSTSPSPAPRST